MMSFYQDEVLPLSRQLGIGVEVEIDLEEQQVAIGSESCKTINLKTKKFKEVAFTLRVLQGVVPILSAIPQMQPLYQQRAQDMSVLRIFYVLNLVGFRVFSSVVTIAQSKRRAIN